MRARNLKPEFFVDEDLGECSIEARLLFAGLWCVADRLGRLEDRPKRLKGQLFPYDTLEVEPLLAELQNAGMIERYEIAEHRYIAIPNFLKHQSPYRNEKESIIPPPPNYDLRNGNSGARKRTPKPGKRTGGASAGPANVESLLANPQDEQIQRETASACTESAVRGGLRLDTTASGESEPVEQVLAAAQQSCPDSCLLIPDSGLLIADVGFRIPDQAEVAEAARESEAEPTTPESDRENDRAGDGEMIRKAFPFRFSLEDGETSPLNFDQGKLLAKYRDLTGNHPKERDSETAKQMWTEGVFTFPSLIDLMDTVFVRSGGAGIGSLGYFKASIDEISRKCEEAGKAARAAYVGGSKADSDYAVLRAVRRIVGEWEDRIFKEAV